MPPLHLHRLPRLLRAMSLAICLALVQAAAWAAPWLDGTPRIAIISAFPAEMNLLLARVQAPRPHVVNGVTFATGQLQGKPVVLLHSGKGGGLSDMFGGGMGAAAQGSTVVEKNLDRITVGFAVVFGFTSLGLGLLMSTPT